MNTNIKQLKRISRHKRIRARVSGTAERPRLAVWRSNRFVQAQLIDDARGATIGAASDKVSKTKGKVARATEVGTAIAAVGKKLGVTKVVFDRGGFLFTGRIKAVADAAREAGLEF